MRFGSGTSNSSVGAMKVSSAASACGSNESVSSLTCARSDGLVVSNTFLRAKMSRVLCCCAKALPIFAPISRNEAMLGRRTRTLSSMNFCMTRSGCASGLISKRNTFARPLAAATLSVPTLERKSAVASPILSVFKESAVSPDFVSEYCSIPRRSSCRKASCLTAMLNAGTAASKNSGVRFPCLGFKIERRVDFALSVSPKAVVALSEEAAMVSWSASAIISSSVICSPFDFGLGTERAVTSLLNNEVKDESLS